MRLVCAGALSQIRTALWLEPLKVLVAGLVYQGPLSVLGVYLFFTRDVLLYARE